MIFLPVRLTVLDNDQATPLEGVLIYNAADPWAVGLDVIQPPFGTAQWHFARDLLADGAATGIGTGDGDVRIWKCEQHSVHIMLTSDEGRANLHIDGKEITGFLAAAYLLVPRGHEMAGIDTARELAKIFGEAA